MYDYGHAVCRQAADSKRKRKKDLHSILLIKGACMRISYETKYDETQRKSVNKGINED